ncbi:hypothetical protein [Hymenobacter antarcticus]|uniref:Uncharacterized protein n=1 Tax=Hymenobacter antarcticus TaxID=486270 RepID=A0ABP7NZV7_9BACT
MSSTKSNQQSSENKGAPTQSEQPKGAGGLPVSDLDDATRERLEQEALDAGILHPNRNLDKPEIDKPAYGGGH